MPVTKPTPRLDIASLLEALEALEAIEETDSSTSSPLSYRSNGHDGLTDVDSDSDSFDAPKVHQLKTMRVTRILIICCVPEMASGMAPVATAVRHAFESKCRVYGLLPTVEVTTRRDRGACMAALGAVASHLELPDAKAIVYQVRDASGDEADGMDEVYELSALFSRIHDSSRLYLFSDSCSSMLDTTNGRPWVAIGSACDGGAFTMSGLIPALRIDVNLTPRQLVAALDIDTQTCTLTAGNERVADEPMF
jgi:hypothetical protein